MATPDAAGAAARPSGRVLIVAGSDSGGGAGIQADIKAVTALGGFAMTAVTALTAQNTTGVWAVHEVPAGFVREQIRVVLEDIGADVVKIGMLGATPMIEAVAAALAALAPDLPVVLDPVMVAKGGHPLLARDAVETLRAVLLPRALVVTPNTEEAALLTGVGIGGVDDQIRAGAMLRSAGAAAALVKGGHMAGPEVDDVLVEADGVTLFRSPRIDTRHTHGTGCTLASAVATGLAQGLGLREAVARARAYVHAAILAAPGLGAGHGPLGHGHTVRPFPVPADIPARESGAG